jgi:hypothetical protein
MRLRALFVIVLLGLLVACTPTTPTPIPPTNTPIPPTDTPAPPTDTPTGFVPFDEFVQGVRDAAFDEYAQREGAAVRDADAFEEMRQHILTMYDGAEQVSTFVYDDQYVDCITVESQPSARLQDLEIVRDAPDSTLFSEDGTDGEAPGTGEGLESPLRMGLTDAFGNRVQCEEGTIPMARLTLDIMTRFETLDAFFGKGVDGRGEYPQEEQLPEGDSPDHMYAAARQNVTNFGGNSWLNLWNPNVPSNSDFSLSQQWYAGGDGDGLQTVEGGWQVYNQKYGNNNARLFIFYTADNYQKKKCYNLDCAAFVQTNNNWFIGGPWSAYSSSGGTQWGFEMQWKYFQGNWWLFLRGPGAYEAVGYYPGSLFGNGQLARSASEITFGGEVTGSDNMPQMGSGAFSDQGWQRAAFQNTIFYIPRDENNGVGVWADLFEIEPNPRCYTIDITPASRGGSWGTYFYFGGPGGDACG